jgi:prevent-host-death family protein
MEKTNANDFRSNLKAWLESAKDEPVKITRKTGDSFVLINADEFEKIQIELASLRGIAQGLSELANGRVKPSQVKSAESAIERAKERVLRKKNKKAVS